MHDATTVTIKTGVPKSISLDQAQDLRRLTRQWARTEGAVANPYTDAALLPDFVDALIGTAARTSELLAWRWDEDIDLNVDPPAIAISGTIVFIKGGDGSGTSTVRQDTTKSARGMRGVTMPAPIVPMMRRRLAARQPGHEFVFGHKHGQALAPSSLRILWRAAIAGTALQGTTPRAGRKLGATAVANTHGAERAAGQMGNTRLIAEKHYIDKSNLHDNRDIFEALLALPVEDLEVEMLAKLTALQAAAVDMGIDDLRVGGILDRLADAGAQLVVYLEAGFAHASEAGMLTAAEEILGAPVIRIFDDTARGYVVLNAFSGPETLGMPFS